MCGAGVFVYKDDNWHEFTEIPLIFTERIRGIDNNDVFVAGDFGLVAHFNGINWKIYTEVAAGLYYSCDYKGNVFVAVGAQNPPAVILQMFR